MVTIVIVTVVTKAVLQREKNLGRRIALLPGKYFQSGKFFKKIQTKYLLFK